MGIFHVLNPLPVKPHKGKEEYRVDKNTLYSFYNAGFAHGAKEGHQYFNQDHSQLDVFDQVMKGKNNVTSFHIVPRPYEEGFPNPPAKVEGTKRSQNVRVLLQNGKSELAYFDYRDRTWNQYRGYHLYTPVVAWVPMHPDEAEVYTFTPEENGAVE